MSKLRTRELFDCFVWLFWKWQNGIPLNSFVKDSWKSWLWQYKLNWSLDRCLLWLNHRGFRQWLWQQTSNQWKYQMFAGASFGQKRWLNHALVQQTLHTLQLTSRPQSDVEFHQNKKKSQINNYSLCRTGGIELETNHSEMPFLPLSQRARQYDMST